MATIEPAGMAGGAARAAAAAADARRSLRRRHGAGAARPPARPDGAKSVARTAAARLHAAQIRRPHPCQRGVEPDRPAGRREAVRRGLWRPRRPRALRACRASVSPRPPPTTFDKNPKVEGLILDKHGIFSFGASAKESYERMIELVSRAEERLHKNRKAVFKPAQLPQQVPPNDDVAPFIRGACSLKDDGGEGAHRRMILEYRSNDAILNFINGAEFARYGASVVITPDFTIRTKSLAADRADAAGRQARRLQARGARRGRRLYRQLQAVFRPPQRARRRRQENARSAAPHRAGAGARPLRARPLGQGRPHRRRSRRGRGRDHHRRRGHRPLPVDHRSRHVRRRILADRAGQARQGAGEAAGRPGRGRHRRRRRDRRRHRQGVRRGRRRGRAARRGLRRRGPAGQGDRSQRPAVHVRRHQRHRSAPRSARW